MIFGTFIPQGWKMELAGIADPQDKWAKAIEIAVLAEELGYDSVWVYDHFHNVPVPAHETMFECWTTLAAISQRTSRVRLGQMVGCALYRNPGLLAKITSNIDVMSGGRLDWGIGAGWYDGEFKAYDYDFPSAADRIRSTPTNPDPATSAAPATPVVPLITPPFAVVPVIVAGPVIDEPAAAAVPGETPANRDAYYLK